MPTTSVKSDLKFRGGSWGPGMETAAISKGAEEAEWRQILRSEPTSKQCVHLHKVIPEVASEPVCVSQRLCGYLSLGVSVSLGFSQVKSVNESNWTRVLSPVSQEA